MELRPVASDAEWQSLLDAQPEATLYHTLAWLRFQERQFGFACFPLVIHHGDRKVGVFPLFVARRGIFRVSSSPRGVDTLFLGPLLEPALLPELLDGYETWARLHGIDYTTITFTRQSDAGVAAQRGYICEHLRDCTIDLRAGPPAVYGRFDAECRRRIRRAEHLGVRIVEGDITPYLELYVRLSDATFAKWNRRTILTRPMMADMLRTLQGEGRLLSLRAEVNGEIAGMYVAARYGKTLYAIDTVCDYRFRQYGMSNLMNWHVLQWACRQGLEVFDFIGANTPSIAKFKASFGAVIRPYSNIKKSHTFLAGLAAGLAEAARKAGRRGFRHWGRQHAGPQAACERGAANSLEESGRGAHGVRPAGPPDAGAHPIRARWANGLKRVRRKARARIRRLVGLRPPFSQPVPARVAIGGVTWAVEVLMTARQRYVGLSGRDHLADGCGMLFVYPDEQVRQYSMRDCRIPIDIAFLSTDRRVVAVHTMTVEPDLAGRTAYSSHGPAQYVLEVPAGEFARAGIAVGSQVEFLDGVPDSAEAEEWP